MENTITITIDQTIANNILDLAGFEFKDNKWICTATGHWFWMKDEAIRLALTYITDHATI